MSDSDGDADFAEIFRSQLTRLVTFARTLFPSDPDLMLAHVSLRETRDMVPIMETWLRVAVADHMDKIKAKDIKFFMETRFDRELAMVAEVSAASKAANNLSTSHAAEIRIAGEILENLRRLVSQMSAADQQKAASNIRTASIAAQKWEQTRA